MPYQSVQRWLALGKETTRGTSATASLFLPIDPNPTLAPQITWLADKGLRMSPVEQYADVDGVRHDEYSFKGNVFADTFPALLVGLIGPDTVSGTAAPYTHTIGLENDPTTGSQPASYSVYDIDNIAESSNVCKELTGSQVDSVSVSWAVDGALSYQAKMLANPFVETTAPASPAFSTEYFIPAWDGAVSFGGSGYTTMISGSVDLKRNTTAIHTLGQQGPYRLWAGPIAASGKLTVVAEASDTTFTNALAENLKVLSIVFTEPNSGHTVTIQMSAVQLKNPKVSSDKAYQTIDVDFTANANATDATNTGYSPVKTIVTNAKPTAY